jgi:hypothetical protein
MVFLSKRKFVNKPYSPIARFETISDETIKKGECTDIYFVRTEETLRWENINPVVSREVTASALPDA